MRTLKTQLVILLFIALVSCTREGSNHCNRILLSLSIAPSFSVYNSNLHLVIYDVAIFDNGYLLINGVLDDSIYGFHSCQLDSLSINMIKFHLKKLDWDLLRRNSSPYIMDNSLFAVVYNRGNDSILVSDNTKYTKLVTSVRFGCLLSFLSDVIKEQEIINFKQTITQQQIDSTFCSFRILNDSINKYR